MAIAKSTILMKVLVAITGLIMYGFVLGHLVGNLLIFQGPEALNTYGQFLIDLGGGLWLVRGVLVISVLVHIALTIQLTLRNKASKGVGYKNFTPKKSTVSSRWMATAGITILLFLIMHLMHFTWGILPVVDQQFTLVDGRVVHDIYSMVVAGFQDPLYSVVYILAIVGLGLHLKHGFHSMFQTLGFHGPDLTPKLQKLSVFLALGIAIGYIAIPLAVSFGVIEPMSASDATLTIIK